MYFNRKTDGKPLGLWVYGVLAMASINIASADSPNPLSANETHAVLGIVTNFILDDGPQSKVKKTGQTKSYDASGNEVTDGSVKDDGYYRKGIAPHYTRDDTKEVVIDHVTGLMWQDDADAATVTKPWLSTTNYNLCTSGNPAYLPLCYDTYGDTAATYCNNLTLGGYTDWRLPTNEELSGIVDYGTMSPYIDTNYFLNTAGDAYWSISSYRGSGYEAWYVDFAIGIVSIASKGFIYYNVRCVRTMP